MARIVVADDDPDIRDLVGMKLETQGHVVHSAADGKQALSLCITAGPDLLVLDHMMPLMTGLEVLSALRTDPDYDSLRSLPVLLLTARVLAEDIEAAHNAGADAYMGKPFSPNELGLMVADLLASGPSRPSAGECQDRGGRGR